MLVLVEAPSVFVTGALLRGFGCGGWLLLPSAVMRGIHELVVHTIVQLTVVVDLVLPVLVSAPRGKLNQAFLVNHGRLLLVYVLELPIIGHRGVEGGEYDRLSRGVAQGGIHRVKVQLCEAIPWLLIWVLRHLIPVEAVRVIVGKFLPDNFLLLLVEDLQGTLFGCIYHPRVGEDLLDGQSLYGVRLQECPKK